MNMKFKIFSPLLVCLCVITSTKAASKGEFIWYNGGSSINYTISKKVSPVVETALEMFTEDIREVTGAKLLKGTKANTPCKIDIVQMDKDKGALKWNALS